MKFKFSRVLFLTAVLGLVVVCYWLFQIPARNTKLTSYTLKTTKVHSAPKDFRDIVDYSFQIYVINNFDNARLPAHLMHHFGTTLFVIENTVRPDYSTGHLARDWNTGLVQGFRDLDQPASRVVVLLQTDTQEGAGDEFQSFRPEVVQRVGLYDERYCGIYHQEDDYFLRVVNEYMDQKVKITVNDHFHRRVFNPMENGLLAGERSVNGFSRNDPDHQRSKGIAYIYAETFRSKKYADSIETNWESLNSGKRIKPQIESYILYPYFERQIKDLDKKGYVVPPNYYSKGSV